MSVSILVLTRNEQQDLPGCLDSVAWSDDVHVYDSHSTDETVTIAAQRGARITQRAGTSETAFFGGDEAEHKNWGLRNIPFKYGWVFQIDADERVTPALAAAVQRLATTPQDCVAFRVQRRDFFMGRWLRHVQTSPYYLRLFRPERMRYERLVNPVSIADGAIGSVEGYLDHFPFSKGMEHWLTRHNNYSSLEARQIVENGRGKGGFSIRKVFFSPDFHERRFNQKELFYRLPGRPLLKFLLLYIVKGGFLDGRPGLTYATLQSIYEYFIVQKTREIRSPERL